MTVKGTAARALAVAVIGAGGVGHSQARGQSVHNLTQGTDHATIQAAINAAVDGDEIEADPGFYAENVDFIDKDILLRSTDPTNPAIVAATIIDGGGLDTCVTLSAGELSGFFVTNGFHSGPQGAGVDASGSAIVSFNIIVGNEAAQRGGGVSATNSAVVHNNVITSNSAGNRAGGVDARDDSQVINNYIAMNAAFIGGGGIRAQENSQIRNNTVLFNSSEDTGSGVVGGGGILAEDASVVVNNIVAFSSDGVGIHAPVDSTLIADFNCVFGNLDGEYSGNAVPGLNDLNVDPLMAADDIHLNFDSPCIDAGDPALGPESDELDLDGEARVYVKRVDIGADEVRDCNHNAVSDDVELSDGTSADCDSNTVPDECDLAGGASDDCNGNAVLDGCDLASGTSQDCNLNAAPDECDVTIYYSTASGGLTPFGDGFPQGFALTDPPVALGDVELSFSAIGDLDSTTEFVEVDLNGTPLGTIFEFDGSQCPTQPDSAVLMVAADAYNAALDQGAVVINMVASAAVTPGICPEEFISVDVVYAAADAPISGDCNLNIVPDECEMLVTEYRALDSAAPGGPTFLFEDISSTGAPLYLTDDSFTTALPFGFDFEFFGVIYTHVYVSSNGFLTFLAGQSSGCCTGPPIPTVDDPNAIIAGWWEDLQPALGGTLHHQTLGTGQDRRWVLQFTDVPHFSGGDEVTLQFKLFEVNGSVELHYQSAPSDGGTHTVGIEDPDGLTGVQYFNGTDSLTTPWVVRFELDLPDCNGNGALDECDLADGTSQDGDGDGVPDECDGPPSCAGDANGDGTVDPFDSGYVLSRLNCLVGTGDPDCDAADVNGDVEVDPLDVGYVLARFGACN